VKKIKVMTVMGTRPEIIKLSRVMPCLDKYFDHVLVHTGQNYDFELNEIFFKELGLRPPDTSLSAAGETPGQTIGNIITTTDSLLEKEKPDALLILGDTNSCLCAIPAKRRKVPVFHMEAGNRCFDQRVPEEINRKIVDHISDINMPYSSIAREYLLAEGFPADRIIKTGSPMFEVLSFYSDKIQGSDVLERLSLKEKGYFLISFHREENVDNEARLAAFSDILNIISKAFKMPVVVTTHPRTRKRLDEKRIEMDENVVFSKPFGLFDYVKLQINARAILSDSGTINEEASILNIPALNLREAFERPEGMEEGTVMLTGLNPERVMQGLDILAVQPPKNLRPVNDYNIPNVSEKVAKIILSYLDYANRVVWKK